MPPPVRIVAGELDGHAFWDEQCQTFAVSLDVFERGVAPAHDGPPSAFMPSTVRHGTRFAQFITTDSLANHLAAVGLGLDAASLQALCHLGREVSCRLGDAEFVGFTAPGIRHHLYLKTPAGVMVAMRPTLDHPDHDLRWGDTSEATVETARLLCEQAWVRPPAADIEIFALALTHEYLALVDSDFSLNAPAVCDWFLTDSPPSTMLDADDRSLLRMQAGFTMRQDRPTPGG